MSNSAKSGKAERSTGSAAPAHDSPGARALGLAPVPSGIDFVDRASPARGEGLPPALREGIESLSGLSMDHVRVHYDSPRPAALGTLAYAQGSEIHLAPGQERTLPHEAWHVVQQAQGRVAPTAQTADGLALNEQSSLEREADAMGARALPPSSGLAAPRGERAAPQGGPSAVPLTAHGTAGAGAVVQAWPGFIDKWLQKRRGFAPVEDPDRPLVQESKVVGHQAQKAEKTVEAQRRDKAKEGLAQVGEEAAKLGLDALGTATTGVPIGSIVGGVRSAQKIASTGHEAYRQTGSSESVVGAVGKEVAKEAVGEALGNIPVIGEFIGMVEGLGMVAYSVFQSEGSRFEEKQRALDNLLDKAPLIERARKRLAEGDLEADSQRRLKKAVRRYEKALAAGRKWQQGKAEKGKMRLLAREVE